MGVIRSYVLGYPVLLPLAYFMTWFLGRLTLGWWPRPSLDDPRSLGPWVDGAYFATLAVSTVGLALFLVGVVSLVAMAFRQPGRRPALLLTAAGGFAAFVAAVIFLRTDPGSMMTWFAD